MVNEQQTDASPLEILVRGTSDDAKMERKLLAEEAETLADAAAHGGIVPPIASEEFHNRRISRLLPLAKPPLAPPGDTETELNGLIAECRFLMREVAFTSACLTYDAHDRIRYLNAAQGLASTAALLADSVGRLRAGPAPKVETRRHEMVYLRASTAPDTSPLPAEGESAIQ